jgi:hypothetical protein
MAISEVIPTFSNIPSTSDPTNFDSEADNFLGIQLPAFVASANTWAGQCNTVAAEVDANAAAADDSAANAAASAAYKGNWSSLTGPVVLPYSVSYNGVFYIALSAFADVTTKVPGVDVEWGALNPTTREARTSNTILGPADQGKLLDFTSGTFSQTVASAVTLGANWYCYATLTGTGAVTLDPNLSQTIDGAPTLALVHGITYLLMSNGANLITEQMAKPAGTHEVVVHTGNGHGSTNNKIRRFGTAMTNTGAAITYADSAGNGGSFTINQAGLYALQYSDSKGSAAAHHMGISVNSAALTTSVATIPVATRLVNAKGGDAGGDAIVSVARTVRLAVGDIVRAHTDGTHASAADTTLFSITKVGV